jgi:aerobic-type carbon monoxide dehydrogenase small subunit (CoxS/CutS family)
VKLVVNGAAVDVEAPPLSALVHVLRDELGLTGTKIGCYEGRCGACTVLLDGRPVVACLTPAAHAEGREVTTVEGLAGSGGDLTPLQEAMLDTGGAQCGACTPGILLTLTSFLREHPVPTELEVREALDGHLCRCTGYRAIIDAALALADGGGA